MSLLIEKTSKICSRCNVIKELSEFQKNKQSKDGLKSVCKDCIRVYNHNKYLQNKNNPKRKESRKRWRDNNKEKIATINKFRRIKKTYGITKEEYYDLIESQDNTCPICNLSLNGDSQIDVDHCHKTGNVRGILHNVCNRFVSCIEEDSSSPEERLKNTIKYIESFNTNDN